MDVTLHRWSPDDQSVLERANTPEMTRFLGGPETPEQLAGAARELPAALGERPRPHVPHRRGRGSRRVDRLVARRTQGPARVRDGVGRRAGMAGTRHRSPGASPAHRRRARRRRARPARRLSRGRQPPDRTRCAEARASRTPARRPHPGEGASSRSTSGSSTCRPSTSPDASPTSTSGSRGESLDRERWWPFYTPHWSSRERAAARYDLGDEGLTLRIDEDTAPVGARARRRAAGVAPADRAALRAGRQRDRPASVPTGARRGRGAAGAPGLARAPRRHRSAAGGDPASRRHGGVLADRLRGAARRLRRDLHRRDLRIRDRRHRRLGRASGSSRRTTRDCARTSRRSGSPAT